MKGKDGVLNREASHLTRPLETMQEWIQQSLNVKPRFGLHDRWRLQQASVCPTEGNEHGELSARVFDSDSQVIIAIVANALSIVNKLSLT